MENYENQEFIGDLDIGTENLELEITETQTEENQEGEDSIPFKVVRAYRYAVNRRGELEKRYVGQATVIPTSYIEKQQEEDKE